MRKKIKKYFKVKESKVSFTDIDKKILMGWECNYFTGKNKKYLEKIKDQTESAISNMKYISTKSHL
tara:strand:- start:241 stop:438 length:198 start_codon:yes stop_codon:yes gene_type:complete